MRATVLIVHRDDTLRDAIRDYLLFDHYKVVCAHSTEGVVEAIAAGERPDIMLVDEDAIGPDWQQRLARVAVGTPCVLMTWKPREPRSREVFTLQLQKPFRAQDLSEALIDVLMPSAGRSGL